MLQVIEVIDSITLKTVRKPTYGDMCIRLVLGDWTQRERGRCGLTDDVRTGIESFFGRRTGRGGQQPGEEGGLLAVAVDQQSSDLGVVNVVA